MVQRSLYEMIGVGPDAAPADVRYAYEQAMRLATRGGDHRRAVELSAAFDALDPRSRRSIFPAARSGPGSALGEHAAGIHPGDYDLASAPAGQPSRFRRHSRAHEHWSNRERTRAWSRRILATLVALGLILLIGTYVWSVAFPRPQSFPSQVQQQDQPANGP